MNTVKMLCIWPNCRFPAEPVVKLCEHHARVIAREVAKWPEQETPQRRQGPSRTPGEIYYLRLNDLIKIGWSHDFRRRVMWYPGCKVLALHPGSREDETVLHRQFISLRAHKREWYHGDAQIILDHIAQMVAEHGEPRIKSYP